MNKIQRNERLNRLPHCPVSAKRTTGFFCCRNNGQRNKGTKISRGSLEYAAKHGLPDFRYPKDDPKYQAPPKNWRMGF